MQLAHFTDQEGFSSDPGILKRGPSQSPPEYSLSLVKKLPNINKNSDYPQTVLVIVFRIASTLDVKIGWFGRQVAV